MSPSVLTKYSLFMLCLFSTVARAQSTNAGDLDRDGVPDNLEQALLEKFRPTFMVSPLDCDRRPAEFVAGSKNAVPLDRNGTIYGQVFRPQLVGSGDAAGLELHYYHLWSRDCGKMGHALDAEYVASLIRAEHAEDSLEKWKAVYWYAAAHEGTVCDSSSIVRAAAIGAEDRGATVWVSSGKHGSYLNRESCEKGCGHDRCVNSIVLEAGRIINVGEPGAALNGAEWTSSTKWSLAQKMRPAFSPELLAMADKPGSDPVLARTPNARWQSTIAAMGSSVDAAGLGPQHTRAALSTANTRTRRAWGLGLSKARNYLMKAKQATAQWSAKQGGSDR